MSCQRKGMKPARRKRSDVDVRVTNAEALCKALEWVLPDDSLFANYALHGNIAWNPRQVAFQALLWRWEEAQHLTCAFDHATEVCRDLGFGAVANNYTSFMNALCRHQALLGERLDRRLQQLQKQVAGKNWRSGEWVPLAFDGSSASAARTVSNERAFCARNYGTGTTAKYRRKKTKGMRRKKNEKNKPQPPHPKVRLTLFWHMSLRLPWDWRLGPSDASERQHVAEMLADENLPQNALFCGDAGFVGYPLWKQLFDSGSDFLVRVGANVNLLGNYARIDRIGDGLVWCWPKGCQGKDKPPLRLRLVKLKIGKTAMWMLTNVLDRKRLTKKMIIRFYKARWGIELEFRGLKQTLKNDKLRGRTSARVLVELDWSIRAMMVAELLALRSQLERKSKQEIPENAPSKPSLAKTMQAIRNCMRYAHKTPTTDNDLNRQLKRAIVAESCGPASKQARYRPKNPDKRPLGDPKVRLPDDRERKKLKERLAQLAS